MTGDNVTHFPGCEELSLDEAGEAVFVQECECGCISFFVLSCGNVKCVACGDLLEGVVWQFNDDEEKDAP